MNPTFKDLIFGDANYNYLLNGIVKTYTNAGVNITISNNWINAIATHLNNLSTKLFNYELLYDLETSGNILNSILAENFFYLYNKFLQQSLLLDVKWTDINNYQNITTMDDTSTIGYSGYSIDNQSGEYQKNTGNKNIKSGNTLEYLQFFNSEIDKWGSDIMSIIKTSLLRTIY